VFAEDEDLARRRLGLREEFPVEAMGEAAGAGLAPEGRAREEGLALAVDDPWTLEVDDALSLSDPGPEGGWRVLVHVADPAALVPAGGPVDREALARGVTHYFPSGRVPMLPPLLGEEAASLGGGGDRPALTFEIAVSEHGEVREVAPRLTLLARVRRLTYDEADRLLLGPGEEEEAAVLSSLAALGRARLRRRLDAGAVLLRRPELDVRVGEGGIEVRRIETASPSRLLVAEMMVLAGEAVARWLSERDLPAIYRRQPPLDEPVEEGAVGLTGPYDPVRVREVRRKLRPGEVRTEPGPHHGLGLPSYVQVTSPLRRYQDLAVHRQIRAALRGDPPPYDREALQRVAATTEGVEREGRAAERDSSHFWLLRYLEGRVGEECEAVVLETGRRSLVELQPYLTNAGLPPRGTHAPGARVRVRIASVRARAGLLRVDEVG
jgi:exoribonuclease-2